MTQASLLKKYTKAYMEGRVPEKYTKDSVLAYMGQYRGKIYNIPLPRYSELEAAVEDSKRNKASRKWQ